MIGHEIYCYCKVQKVCYFCNFQKIICTDQLYGWRGIDTGYYGSEEVEDAPDFLDEVKIPSKENEVRDEQLEALRQEAVDRLKKVVFKSFPANFLLNYHLTVIVIYDSALIALKI